MVTQTHILVLLHWCHLFLKYWHKTNSFLTVLSCKKKIILFLDLGYTYKSTGCSKLNENWVWLLSYTTVYKSGFLDSVSFLAVAVSIFKTLNICRNNFEKKPIENHHWKRKNMVHWNRFLPLFQNLTMQSGAAPLKPEIRTWGVFFFNCIMRRSFYQ
jgi:hypothetical protein